jgi:hypothetical protein
MAMLHEATAGPLRDIDRLATAASKAAARRKVRQIDRDLVEHVLDGDRLIFFPNGAVDLTSVGRLGGGWPSAPGRWSTRAASRDSRAAQKSLKSSLKNYSEAIAKYGLPLGPTCTADGRYRSVSRRRARRH